MIDRRAFIKSAAGVAFGGLTAACETHSEVISAPARLERIGVGLFTMPHLLEQNFAEAMKKLARIGYKEVEFFGPYWFGLPAMAGIRPSGSSFFPIWPIRAAVSLIWPPSLHRPGRPAWRITTSNAT